MAVLAELPLVRLGMPTTENGTKTCRRRFRYGGLTSAFADVGTSSRTTSTMSPVADGNLTITHVVGDQCYVDAPFRTHS